MLIEQVEKVQEVMELLIAEIGLANIPMDLEKDVEDVLTILNEEVQGALYGDQEEGSLAALAGRDAPVVEGLEAGVCPVAGVERVPE